MKLLRLACGLWLACSSVAAVACEQPTVPIIPAKQDLGRLERHRIVRNTRAYATAMPEYVTCIKRALQAAGTENAPDLSRKLLNRRYESAVREFKVVLALFVERVGPLDSLGIGRGVDTKPSKCISMRSAGKTLALNDSTVLFYQRMGRIYINRLPKACPGLRRSGGGFAASARSPGVFEELCAGDTVTLIRGSHAGFACRLGRFQELTKEQAAALLDSSRPQLDDGSVTVTPAQLPPDGDEASEPGKQR